MAFDPEDPEAKAAIEAAVREANQAIEKSRADVLKENAAFKRKLNALGEVDIEEVHRLQAVEADLERKKAEAAGDFKKLEEQTRKQAQMEIDKREQRVNRYRAEVERLRVDSEAIEAVTALKGKVRVLLPHIKARTRVEELDDGTFVTRVVDEHGQPRVSDVNGTPMTIAALAAELRDDPDFAGNFEGTGSTGTGQKTSQTGARFTPGGPKVIPNSRAEFLQNLEGIAKGSVGVAGFEQLIERPD